MFKKKQQQRQQGLDQLLNFTTLIEDNIILNKDGSLISGFYYNAPDASNISKLEANSIVEKVNQAGKILTDGYTIYFDVIRFASNNYSATHENYFPDEVSKAIDEERRKQFQQENSHFESRYIIIICYHQHQKHMDSLDKWLFGGEEKGSFSRILTKFKNTVEEFIKLLSFTIKIIPMQTKFDTNGNINDELCNYLHSSLIGENKQITITQPAIDLHLRLCKRDFIAGNICKMGDKYIQAISITDFPDTSYANILGSLDMLNIAYRWSTRFIFVDKLKSGNLLEKKEKSWDEAVYTYKDMLSGKMGMSMGKPNRHALNMSYDANNALNEDRSGVTKYGYYTVTIIVMHEDVEIVRANAKFIAEVIESSSNFDAYVEGINTTDAFFGSIAGHIHCNKRVTPMNTLNLATLIQTSSVYCGEQYSPNPFLPQKSPPLAYARTNGSNPYRLNLHVRDVGHTIIVGPTGNGKSTLLAFLLAQYLRYPQAKIFIFDKKESLYAITKSVNGIHYYLAKDEMALCPLALVKDAESLTWAVNYLISIIEMQGQIVNAQQKHMLMLAVQGIAAQTNKSLSALIAYIQDESLKLALRQYTKAGTLGTLLDGTYNIINQGSITTFELDSLLKMGEKNLVAVLGYLFYYIESQLDGSPTIIALEEVWLVMLRNFFKEKFTEWLVTLRKQNCSVIFTCTNLAQLYSTDSSTLSAIIDSTATKIFLPNKEAAQKGTLERAGNYELYQMFGLNEHEITQVIAKATPKRDYYIKQEHGSRLVQFDFGTTVLKYCGISGTDEVEQFKKQQEAICQNLVDF